jgi:hypothetical protein
MMTWKPYYSEGFAAGWRELKLVNIHLRLATDRDVEKLSVLIEALVRGLQSADYSPEQIEGARTAVYGVDKQLIADGTYFLAECEGEIAACAVGANAKLSAAAISMQGAKTLYLIR